MKIYTLLILFPFVQSCTMFEKDEHLLAQHQKTNGQIIKIFYVGMGATTADVIQIRRGNEKSPLKVFENYNYLEKSELIGDTLLRVILTDTGYIKNKPDTVDVVVK